MASLRHFSALTKNSLCSNSFASTEKCSDGLIYTRICLKSENYIFTPNILFNYDNLIGKNAIKTILEYKTLIEKTFLVEINKINEKWIELKKENKKRTNR